MKRGLFTVVIFILFVACTARTPKDVAKAFLEALAEGDTKEALYYATPKMAEFIKNSSAFGGIPKNPDFRFTFIKTIKEHNRTEVLYKNEHDQNRSLILISIDNVYKVDVQ